MIPYELFQLNENEINRIKKHLSISKIAAYIKEHGHEPEDITQFYTASDEELERYRRIEYAMLHVKNHDTPINPHDSIPNNEIWYTTYDGNAIVPTVSGELTLTGSKLLKNIYKNGLGILTFENEITYLANGGFSGLSNLKSITIPDSINTIGEGCFSSSGIEKFEMSENSQLKEIYGFAFRFCKNLKSLNITSAEHIGTNTDGNLHGNVFYGCTSLTDIVLPSNCTTIGGRSFTSCPNLSNITLKSLMAPIIQNNTFVDHNNGHYFDLAGENVSVEKRKLKIYEDSIGYYDGTWAEELCKKCGFHIEYIP